MSSPRPRSSRSPGPACPRAWSAAAVSGPAAIVVARYFLFPGVLPDRVTEQAAEFAAAHPGLDVRVTDVLGDCDEIAGLVAERYREALEGDIRMNCDLCVYRTALPGFAHRVGLAAVAARPSATTMHHAHGHADAG